MCCSKGKIQIPPIDEPVDPLKSLLLNDSVESRHFLNNVRRYNSCFQMTSFGTDRKVVSSNFSPTFTVQGQVYHTIGSLLPEKNQKPKYLQIYFMGQEEIQAGIRCECIPGVDKRVVEKLQKMLHEHNFLIKTFKTALKKMPEDLNYKVVIHPDKKSSTEHERRYNAPTVNEVAAIGHRR